MNGSEIAIVGMACRFPGARTPEDFWRNLSEGKEGITFFTPEELEANGVATETIRHPQYVPATAVLDDVDKFDAEFWGVNRREAELMDPQQRLFLECTWQAVERAGYDSSTYPGRIAVYGGCSSSTYFIFQLLPHFQNVDPVGAFQALLLNDKDYLCTRAAYKMNLRGPAITVQTACSTSLVAVHLACQSLLNGECDMALAGGSTIAVPEREGYIYQEGGVLSPDGHCRAFDAKARGTASGNGVGVVLLKRLSDALKDGDSIVAVIKGTALNNDGSDKVGFTAPSVNGQSEVIQEALAIAEVEAETVGYVEAHGTGTPLGDPIEIAALTQAYRATTDRKGFCAIGALKTNVGHMDAAAGIGGLMKVALSLDNKKIAPSLNFESANPQIDFGTSPFFVNTKLRDWTSNGPRRAGVSSFGIGGTNAHIVLEEAPPATETTKSRSEQLYVISAKTETALMLAADQLSRFLTDKPSVDPADVAYTLQVGRQRFPFRGVFVASSAEEARKILDTRDPAKCFVMKQDATRTQVAFLFPGQGAQYAGMAHGLYETEPVFQRVYDECAEILRPHVGLDIRQIPDGLLGQTQYTQPALFAVEYALAQLWISWGIKPSAMMGHSIGEYVAACLAGVMTLADALELVAFRGKLVGSLPAGGAMLSVGLDEETLAEYVKPDLGIAALNAPGMSVLSGPLVLVEALESELRAKNVPHRRLHTSHAFHSKMMDPILPELRARLEKMKLSAPTIPFVSNLTGDWIRPEEATSPDYWVRHLREPVRFGEGFETLLKKLPGAFLEVGPGRTLSTFAGKYLKGETASKVFPALRHPQETESDSAFILRTLGWLWMAGVNVDWKAFYEGEKRRRIVLPTYPFERKSYWVKPPKRSGAPAPVSDSDPVPETRSASEPGDGPSPLVEAGVSEMEEKIIRTWKEFIGVEKIGVNENFFLVGGDSLVASRITARLREWYPVDLQVRHLLEAQTPAKMAAAIETLLVEKLEGLSDEEAEALLAQYS